jgi:hypothetical protein
MNEVKNINLTYTGNGLPVSGVGTVKWSILADNGVMVYLYIRNTLFVPNYPIQLLSPQQAAQQTQKASDGSQYKSTVL